MRIIKQDVDLDKIKKTMEANCAVTAKAIEELRVNGEHAIQLLHHDLTFPKK